MKKLLLLIPLMIMGCEEIEFEPTKIHVIKGSMEFKIGNKSVVLSDNEWYIYDNINFSINSVKCLTGLCTYEVHSSSGYSKKVLENEK